MITPSFSPTATERVLPRMALDFTTGVLDPRVTIARALDTATRVNASGYIETVNANLPRFDYSSTNAGAIKGLLIEEARTNTLAYSNDFTGATWTTSGITYSTSSLTSPSGALNATLMTGTAFSYVYAGGRPNAAGTWTQSFFFSKGTVTNPTVRVQQAGNGYELTFDLTAKTAGAAVIVGTGGSISNMTGAVSEFNATWLRCSVTFTTSSGVNNLFLYVGSGTLHVYGAQLEVGAFATSYIPTTTTSLTRNADVVSMTGTNFSSWFNASEGTFVCATTGGNVSTGQWAVPFDAVGPGNELYVRQTSATAVSSVINGTGSSSVTISSGAAYTSAIAYKLNNCAFAVNASTVSATSAVPTTPTSLILGSLNGTFFLNKHISKFSFYPQRLTNAEVQAFSK
jgi:hypothetical protein